MKSISLFVLIIGIVFITVGYMEKKIEKVKTEKKVEYRFVPRSIYDEQISPVSIGDTFSTMFADIDPIFVDK
jgi:hypothetical protein